MTVVGIGSIIYVRNILFKDATTDAELVDHAFVHGRPCVVVDFDRDFLYFFPITHVKENRNYLDKYVFDKTDCKWKRKKYDKHAIAVKHYYKIPYTQMSVYGKLDPYALAGVMEYYCQTHSDCSNQKFYQNLCYYCDVLKEIGPITNEQLNYDSIFTPYNETQERYEFLAEFNDYLYDCNFSEKSFVKSL